MQILYRVSIVLLILGLFSLTSCKISTPQFKRLSNWSVKNLSTSNITLNNEATFNNPNKLKGMKINSVNIEVRNDGKKIGNVMIPDFQKIQIPSESDFSVPLSISVNPKDIFSNLGSILGALTGQTLNIQCVGDISVGYHILSKNIHIDQTLPVNLNSLKPKE